MPEINVMFSPFKNETYDCFLNNIVSIVRHYYARDYSPVFWTSFDFNYRNLNKDSMKFDDLEITEYNDAEEDILHEICGINLVWENTFAYRDFKEAVYHKITNHEPVGVRIDSFYLPWNKYYKKIYRPHNILICGIKDEDNVICYDGFLTEELQIFPINEIFDHYEHLIFYKNSKNDPISLQECLLYFKNIFSKNNHRKFEQLRGLAYDLKNSSVENFNNYENNNIEYSGFLIKATALCWSRYNFANGIAYFEKTYGYDVSDIYDHVNQIYEEWSKVRLFLLKAVLMKKSSCMKRAGELITDIALEEEAVSANIEKIGAEFL